MKINNISFKGIKVNGREIKSYRPKNQSRQAQREILDKWQGNIDSITTLMDSIKLTPQYEDNIELTKDTRKLVNLEKAEYKELINNLRKDNETLDRRFDLTRELLKMSNEALKNLGIENQKTYQESGNNIIKGKKYGLDKIAGYELEKQVLHSEFIEKVKEEKEGKIVQVPSSILFFGPVGNGKSTIIRSIAEATKCNIAKIKIPVASGEIQKQTMDKIIKTAEKAEENYDTDKTRTIILIDEADKLLGENSPITNDFEEFIKDCSSKYHCTVMAATNYPLKLGLDMQSKEVFPIRMSIEPPEGENAKSMFEHSLSTYPHESIDSRNLVKVMKKQEEKTGMKFNNSQIKAMCTDCFENENKNALTQQKILDVINTTIPYLSQDDINAFDEEKRQLIED